MERTKEIKRIIEAFKVNPVVALLGPRQCGKTTLARQFWAQSEGRDLPDAAYLDLEDPLHEARLASPKLALENLTGLVVIDEIQRAPDLFKVLRVLVDRPKNPARFLILGSASRELIRQSSESLAGRLSYLELTPLSLSEIPEDQLAKLWYRGGFPRSFLAENDPLSVAWRDAYVRTYLEQDIPALGIRIAAPALRRFWTMLAHYHGQVFNASEIGRSMGISDTTARHYLDILSGTFMVRQLQPWHANLQKRQVKSPKIYFRDSGIFHRLIGLEQDHGILMHPKLGASWEGFALEETIRHLRAEEAYFWAVHGQAELDLLIIKNGRRLGFEIKYTEKPKITSSLKAAVELLKLDQAWVVYPGTESFSLSENIEALPLSGLRNQLLDRSST
jgi:predicted AAA+ superfamily ATPase